jgi:hypothetical protein
MRTPGEGTDHIMIEKVRGVFNFFVEIEGNFRRQRGGLQFFVCWDDRGVTSGLELATRTRVSDHAYFRGKSLKTLFIWRVLGSILLGVLQILR